MEIKPLSRRNNLVTQEIGKEVLVYDLENNKAHCLTETAAFIWKNCNGENTISDLKNLIEKEFKASITEDFVWLAIDQLNREELLQEKLPVRGITRREVLKRIGAAAMIALPIVASLTVPDTALASTTCGNICSPANPRTCAPGCTCQGSICV
ncbi:MAG: PqqD family protein [Pyrinomonadaceae bacterium]|nr:PqqD family protein [Pyrinomonadaceae bacterium]MCX7639468.1 PqqD family protein [Pyrinomonadaceae bacterium]MDW8304481.1 PqqD family protein [Acidobacteriota bacterium]